MFTGKINSISRDFKTNKTILAFEINENIEQSYEDLKDCEKLSIEFKKFRKKRSLDANSYLWVLYKKMSEKLNTSESEIHNQMLGEYGQYELDENGKIPCMQMLSKFDDMIIKRSDIHLKVVGRRVVQGKEVTDYALLRGSRTYDTKEMSVLIDGVVSECKELDIDTITPNEIERMKQQWGLKL